MQDYSKDSEMHIDDYKAALRSNTWLPPTALPIPDISLDAYNITTSAAHAPMKEIINQIAEGKSLPPQITMRYELLRMCTFRTYPRGNKPFLSHFAQAGFYYASDQDGVVCYCCGIKKYEWSEKDNPVAVHKRLNMNCNFFNKPREFNIPAFSEGPLRQKVAELDNIPECTYRQDDSEEVSFGKHVRVWKAAQGNS